MSFASETPTIYRGFKTSNEVSDSAVCMNSKLVNIDYFLFNIGCFYIPQSVLRSLFYDCKYGLCQHIIKYLKNNTF